MSKPTNGYQPGWAERLGRPAAPAFIEIESPLAVDQALDRLTATFGTSAVKVERARRRTQRPDDPVSITLRIGGSLAGWDRLQLTQLPATLTPDRGGTRLSVVMPSPWVNYWLTHVFSATILTTFAMLLAGGAARAIGLDVSWLTELCVVLGLVTGPFAAGHEAIRQGSRRQQKLERVKVIIKRSLASTGPNA